MERVLAECGNDIDAAIRRLTTLKLGGSDAATTADGDLDNADTAPQPQGGSMHDAAAPDGAQPVQPLVSAPAAAAAVTVHAAPEQHQPAVVAATTEAAGAAAVAAGAAASGLQTAEQWVDALVSEMAAAKDLGDARDRAAKLLQAFEAFVSARVKAQVRVAWRQLCGLCGRCAVPTTEVALVRPVAPPPSPTSFSDVCAAAHTITCC